jgi:AhpD family alkylhydroperoxidase
MLFMYASASDTISQFRGVRIFIGSGDKHVTMRLEPIEKPKGIMMRFAHWGTRRMFGKVMTPIKVVTARIPESLKLTNEIVKFEIKGIRLDRRLHYMVVALASQINGCSFCLDLARALAIRKHLSMEKFNALSEYRTSPLFSERERAALSYVEEITRNRRVSDATFETLRKHFTEREIVEITWLNAVENYYNLINIPLEIESDGFCALAEARIASRNGSR